MSDAAVYTRLGPATEADDDMVSVRLPADVADELDLATVWLSLRFDHRLPIAELRRALVLGGLAHPGRVLAELQIAWPAPD